AHVVASDPRRRLSGDRGARRCRILGDNAALRRMLHRLKPPYALGISSTLTVFRGTPRSPCRRGNRDAAHSHCPLMPPRFYEPQCPPQIFSIGIGGRSVFGGRCSRTTSLTSALQITYRPLFGSPSLEKFRQQVAGLSMPRPLANWQCGRFSEVVGTA